MSPRGDQIRAAIEHLSRYGFRAERSDHRAVRAWGPFKVHDSPDHCTVHAEGEVEGAHVDLYEYDSTSTDADGNSSTRSTLLAVAAGPWIRGHAGISMDHREWSDSAAFIHAAWDVFTWIPPFILLKVVQRLGEARNPDHEVGHAEFDRLYYVSAASAESAAAAIPEALREALVRLAFRGAIEVRDGYLLVSLNGAQFDPVGVESTLRTVKTFVDCYAAPARAHPMR